MLQDPNVKTRKLSLKAIAQPSRGYISAIRDNPSLISHSIGGGDVQNVAIVLIDCINGTVTKVGGEGVYSLGSPVAARNTVQVHTRFPWQPGYEICML